MVEEIAIHIKPEYLDPLHTHERNWDAADISGSNDLITSSYKQITDFN